MISDNQTTGHENPNHPANEVDRDYTLEDALDQMREKCDDWAREFIEAEIDHHTHRTRSKEYGTDLEKLARLWEMRLFGNGLTESESQQITTILNKY